VNLQRLFTAIDNGSLLRCGRSINAGFFPYASRSDDKSANLRHASKAARTLPSRHAILLLQNGYYCSVMGTNIRSVGKSPYFLPLQAAMSFSYLCFLAGSSQLKATRRDIRNTISSIIGLYYAHRFRRGLDPTDWHFRRGNHARLRLSGAAF